MKEVTAGELSPIPGYRIWTINAVLCVCASYCCVCVFLNLILQKNYKNITSSFYKAFAKIQQEFTFDGII